MKCIKESSGKIVRVTDDEAFTLVKEIGCAEYAKKEDWKRETRDA